MAKLRASFCFGPVLSGGMAKEKNIEWGALTNVNIMDFFFFKHNTIIKVLHMMKYSPTNNHVLFYSPQRIMMEPKLSYPDVAFESAG